MEAGAPHPGGAKGSASVQRRGEVGALSGLTEGPWPHSNSELQIWESENKSALWTAKHAVQAPPRGRNPASQASAVVQCI
jgi:hypothetical protein